jgi:hypothetical protein
LRRASQSFAVFRDFSGLFLGASVAPEFRSADHRQKIPLALHSSQDETTCSVTEVELPIGDMHAAGRAAHRRNGGEVEGSGDVPIRERRHDN